VHLKDLDIEMAHKVRTGQLAFRQAVIDGMFRPLGEGGVDIARTVRDLEAGRFGGWYVLEQDVALAGDPARGEGPIEDARRSIEFLRKLSDESGAARERATG
jgi:inosose dehydratase